MAFCLRKVSASGLILLVATLASPAGRAQDDGATTRDDPLPFPQNIPGITPGLRQDNRSGEVLGPGRRHMYFGPTVIGPGGVVPQPMPQRKAETPKPKVLTPAERADMIRKALAPKPPFAFARRHTLDNLYGKLARASDAEEAKGLATLISNIWLRSGSDTAALLMQRALTAAEKKDYSVSLDLLDRVIEMQPTWAEAWNRRASVRFAAGNLDGSMEDVEHVLKLEPNHFAALEGMAMILQKTGFDKRALQVYRRALAIYPHQPEIEEIVKKLTLEVEGQGI